MKALDKLPAQAVFNKVVRHLCAQRTISTVVADDPYSARAIITRRADGTSLKCAVGCLLPEDVLAFAEKKRLTTCSYFQLAELVSGKNDKERDRWRTRHATLIGRLQSAHDLASKNIRDDLYTNLKRVVVSHNSNLSELDIDYLSDRVVHDEFSKWQQ